MGTKGKGKGKEAAFIPPVRTQLLRDVIPNDVSLNNVITNGVPKTTVVQMTSLNYVIPNDVPKRRHLKWRP